MSTTEELSKMGPVGRVCSVLCATALQTSFAVYAYVISQKYIKNTAPQCVADLLWLKVWAILVFSIVGLTLIAALVMDIPGAAEKVSIGIPLIGIGAVGWSIYGVTVVSVFFSSVFSSFFSPTVYTHTCVYRRRLMLTPHTPRSSVAYLLSFLWSPFSFILLLFIVQFFKNPICAVPEVHLFGKVLAWFAVVGFSMFCCILCCVGMLFASGAVDLSSLSAPSRATKEEESPMLKKEVEKDQV